MTDEMTPKALSRILRPRPAEAHKGTLGHALLVAGRWGVGGCAILAAESCMRAGVGRVFGEELRAARVPKRNFDEFRERFLPHFQFPISDFP